MRRFWRYYFLKVILALVALQLIFFAWLQYRNNAPEAIADTAEVIEDRTVKVNPLTNDKDEDDDELALAGFSQGKNGKVKQQDNYLIYQPNTGYVGVDSFTYEVSDGDKTREAYIKITVNENLEPLANRDELSIFPVTETTLHVLANDNDRERDSIFIKKFSKPRFGEVILQGRELVYKLTDKTARQDSFTYSISDGRKTSEKAIVHITIKQPVTLKFSPTGYGDVLDYNFSDPSVWDVSDNKGNYALSLLERTNSQGGRLGGYALIKNGPVTGDFTLFLKAKSDEDLSSNQWPDFALVYAWQDDMNYCFVSLSGHDKADGATGAYKVVNGQRQTILFKGKGITDNKFRSLKITRKGNTIGLFIDGKEMFTSEEDEMIGRDGSIGVGSINDRASFDNIKVVQ